MFSDLGVISVIIIIAGNPEGGSRQSEKASPELTADSPLGSYQSFQGKVVQLQQQGRQRKLEKLDWELVQDAVLPTCSLSFTVSTLTPQLVHPPKDKFNLIYRNAENDLLRITYSKIKSGL